MSGCLKQFGRLGSLSLVACAFLLLSAPQSVSIADDDIKALERKLELLKKKASRLRRSNTIKRLLEKKREPTPASWENKAGSDACF